MHKDVRRGLILHPEKAIAMLGNLKMLLVLLEDQKSKIYSKGSVLHNSVVYSI
jgi:hypothetical protein